jgi:segregation and condensation protein B
MREEKVAILEALIFASETPLTPERAADVLNDTERKEALSLLEELGREYEARGGGILLVQVAGGFQFRTRPEMAPWIRKLRSARPAMLSPAALETLAVIAYRQPIVKSEIDRIRGVDVSGALKGLLEKKLARIVGRKDVPGKPIIYGTTRKFLEVFNLKDLSELPTLSELKDLQDDSGGPLLEAAEDPQGDSGEPALLELNGLQDDTGGPILAEPKDLQGNSGSRMPTVPELKELPNDGGERQE